MHLFRYRPEYQEPMLALHRSAIAGFNLGMSQKEDEADLMAIEQVYLHDGGEFLVGFINEKLVAMGGFKKLSDTSAEVRRMRIERKIQGRGHGTQLLRELEEAGVPIRRSHILPGNSPKTPIDAGVLSPTRLSRNRSGALWRCRDGPVPQDIG